MLFLQPAMPRRHRRLAPLDALEQQRHKLRNRVQSALILDGMGLLMAICGYILFGPPGLFGIAIAVVAVLFFGTQLSSSIVNRLRAGALTEFRCSF